MNVLKHILERYKNWLTALLFPLGPLGVFFIALVDSASFLIPIDPVVATFVFADPRRTLLYAIAGALGSALGSLVPFAIGYKGGEAFLVKKIGQKRFDRIHGNTEKYGELGLMVACCMPPGFPFKLFVLSAGVAEMTYWRFLLAIFAGRLARFLILSVLVIKFGPQVVSLMGTLFKQHLWATLGGIAALVIIGYLFTRWRGRRKSE